MIKCVVFFGIHRKLFPPPLLRTEGGQWTDRVCVGDLTCDQFVSLPPFKLSLTIISILLTAHDDWSNSVKFWPKNRTIGITVPWRIKSKYYRHIGCLSVYKLTHIVFGQWANLSQTGYVSHITLHKLYDIKRFFNLNDFSKRSFSSIKLYLVKM